MPVALGNDFLSHSGIALGVNATPETVRHIKVDDILLADKRRHRPLNEDKVAALLEDIRIHGLLQPIAVKKIADDPGHYELVFGWHRLEAFRRGWEAALAADDPKGLKLFQTIACSVYPYDMPPAIAELKELSENLHRADLSPGQLSAHRTRYIAIIKKLLGGTGRINSADQAQSGTKLRSRKKTGTERSDFARSPTISEKASVDLGISERQLQKNIADTREQANAVLRDRGEAPIETLSAEKSSPDELARAADLADEAHRAKAKAKANGKDSRKVHPKEPIPENVGTVRLNFDDPAPLIAWCKAHLSRDQIERIGAAIDQLISEQGGPRSRLDRLRNALAETSPQDRDIIRADIARLSERASP